MTINDLLEVVLYAKERITDSGLLESYNKLIQAIQRVQKSPAGEKERERLEEALQSLRVIHGQPVPESWSLERASILASLGFHNIIGNWVVDQLEGALAANAGNISEVNNEINTRVRATKENAKTLALLARMIAPLRSIQGEPAHESSAQLRVTFRGAARIRHLGDLEVAAKRWNDTVGAFSRLVGQSPSDVSIAGLVQGSVILDLVLNKEVVEVLGEGIKVALTLATQYVMYQRIRLDLKKVDMEKQADEVYKKAKNELSESATDAAKRLIDDHADEVSLTDRNELTPLIKLNIERMTVFISEKGRVDLLQPKVAGTDLSEAPRSRLDPEISVGYESVADNALDEADRRLLQPPESHGQGDA